MNNVHMRTHSCVFMNVRLEQVWKSHLSDLALVGGPITVHGEADVPVVAVHVTQSYTGSQRHLRNSLITPCAV